MAARIVVVFIRELHLPEQCLALHSFDDSVFSRLDYVGGKEVYKNFYLRFGDTANFKIEYRDYRLFIDLRQEGNRRYNGEKNTSTFILQEIYLVCLIF